MSPYNNMYLLVLLVLLLLVCSYFYLNTKEGITFPSNLTEILPIAISDDNEEISIPNKIKGRVGDDVAFGGDLIANKNMNVIKNMSVTGTHSVTGSLSANGGLVVVGGETVNGRLQANNGLTVGGGLVADKIATNGLDPNNMPAGSVGGLRTVDVFSSGTISLGTNVSAMNVWFNSNGDGSVNKTMTVGGTLTCANINVTSDKRIKKNIQELSPKDSLELLRRMKPVKYQFKDAVKEVFGFVAQDIQTFLPNSVSTRKQVIHNIYESCTCAGNILTFPTFKTSDLSYDKEKVFPIKMDNEVVHILEIVDDSSVRINKELEGLVFVYGQEVDDFLSIDQNQLFTVATSALQELDLELQATQNAVHQLRRKLQEEKEGTQTEIRMVKRQLQEEKQKTCVLMERVIRLEKNLIL